jgi:hypothetical protein
LSIPAIYLGVKVIPETKNKSLEDLEKYWMKQTMSEINIETHT